MDFSSHNPRTCNALSLAARANDVPKLRRLLKKLNPNSVDNRGWTCLHEAAYHDSLECLVLILKCRATRPLVESHEGHTALYVACLNNSIRCMKYLLQNVDNLANYGSKEGFTPLHLACSQGYTDALQLLLDHGAMIDAVDFDGDTPLHEACMARQSEVVNILLHAGAQPEIQNDRLVTPLHMACGRGSFETVQYLYPFITDINMLDGNSNSPLLTACHGENEDLIQFLLEHGADPNVQNIADKMPIDLAMEQGLVRTFKLLFQMTDRAELNMNLVYFAISTGYFNFDIVDTLLASDLDPEFFMYTQSWDSEIYDCAMTLNTTMDMMKGLSLYEKAAGLNKFLTVAEYIYKLSVDKLYEVLCLVLMKGLSVNAIYSDEMPPLVWFQYCPHSVCFEYILDLLVQFGCNVDYCSDMCTYNKADRLLPRHTLSILGPDQNKLVRLKYFPDAFYYALVIDPVTLPMLIKYSLQCDPGYILQSALDFGALECLPPATILQLMQMIDSDCQISEYEGFKHFVPSLKHLSRLQVRQSLKQESFRNTQQFFDFLDSLPLPKQIIQYLRFL